MATSRKRTVRKVVEEEPKAVEEERPTVQPESPPPVVEKKQVPDEPKEVPLSEPVVEKVVEPPKEELEPKPPTGRNKPFSRGIRSNRAIVVLKNAASLRKGGVKYYANRPFEISGEENIKVFEADGHFEVRRLKA